MNDRAGGAPVVVGVDARTPFHEPLRWAVTEAAARHAPLVALHAYQLPVYADLPGGLVPTTAQPDPELAVKAAHAELDAVLRATEPWLASLPDRPPIEARVAALPAGRALVEAGTDAGMVVVGSHRPGALRGLLLGSVSHYVLQHARAAVAVVPEGMDGARPRRHIAVGIDGSAPAARALAYAWREAGLWGATLDVVHAWEYPYLGPRFLTAEGRRYMEEDAHTVVEQAVLRAQADAAAAAAPGPETVSTHVIEGPASRVLVEVAHHADELVVSRRGRGGVASALLGSVSLSVCHHANCPVVVVH